MPSPCSTPTPALGGGPCGYVVPMSEMADHRKPLDLEGVPEGEDVSEADAAERVDEEPEEQGNRRDPVLSGDDDD